MSKIVILGGHGAVAMIAGRKLVEAGHQVTSVIRSADQKTEIEAIGATPLVLDLQEASTEQLDAAIAGHDAVVWAAGSQVCSGKTGTLTASPTVSSAATVTGSAGSPRP